MPQIVWVASSEGRIEYLNRSAVEYTGFGREPSGGQDLIWSALFHPDEAEAVRRGWVGATADGSPLQTPCCPL